MQAWLEQTLATWSRTSRWYRFNLFNLPRWRAYANSFRMGPMEDSTGSRLPFAVCAISFELVWVGSGKLESSDATGDIGLISSSSSSAKLLEGGGLDDMINEEEIKINEWNGWKENQKENMVEKIWVGFLNHVRITSRDSHTIYGVRGWPPSEMVLEEESPLHCQTVSKWRI